MVISALAGTGKFGDLGARWDRKVVWDAIVVMTRGRSWDRKVVFDDLGARWDRIIVWDDAIVMTRGCSLGPESRLW